MISKIELKNWKKHSELIIDFNKGSNIIIGNMGSGKTSILQAITYCLFGTFSELKKRDLKVNDLIKKGETISEIKLTLKSNNEIFLISRKVEYDKLSEATIRDDNSKLLAGPSQTAVNDYIIDKLKITEDIFLRTIYSVQNEADILLRIGPAERKKQIDELMNLNQFEIVRKNCVSLSNKLIERKRGMLSILNQENIDSLIELKSKLSLEITTLKSEKIKLNKELPILESDEINKRKNLENISIMNSRKNQLVGRQKLLNDKLNEINLKIAGQNIFKTESEINKLINSLKIKNSSLRDEIKQFKSSKENFNQDLIIIEKQRGIVESTTDLVTKEISSLMELKLRFKDLQIQDFRDLDLKINSIKSEIKLKDDLNRDNNAEINNMRKQMNQLEVISDICPLCRHEMSQHSKDQLLSERKQEIAKLLMENNDISTKLQSLTREQKNLTKSYDEQQEYLSNAEKESDLNEQRDKSNSEFQSLTDNRNTLLRKLEESKIKIDKLDSDISEQSDEIEKLVDSKSLISLTNNKTNLEDELAQIKNELKIAILESKNYDSFQKDYESSLDLLNTVRANLKSSSVIILEKRNREKEIFEKINNLKKYHKSIKLLDLKVDFLSKLKNALIDAQEVLRDELLLAVNEVMSSTWMQIYPYDVWSGLRISTLNNDYTIQLKEADGDWVNVSGFASGGERMLASLAVKISFARVLAPNLNMLILDEPTHNLDEIAVRNFIDVLNEKISEHIDQMFIITHDERLAESASKVIKLV